METFIIIVFWVFLLWWLRRRLARTATAVATPEQLLGHGPRKTVYQQLLSDITEGVDRTGAPLTAKIRTILKATIVSGVKDHGTFKGSDEEVRSMVLRDMYRMVMDDYLKGDCLPGCTKVMYAEAAIWIEDHSDVTPMRGV